MRGASKIVAMTTIAIGAVALNAAPITAASNPKPPAISFGVAPDFVACHSGEAPTTVKASWRIVHSVTSATITGAVDKLGNPLRPITLPTTRGHQGVVGSKQLHMLCSATTQVLTLTATGTGGTTRVTASLGENRSD